MGLANLVDDDGRHGENERPLKKRPEERASTSDGVSGLI
jgi:hypothetical protein